MNREKLNRHKQNKRELALVNKQLERLHRQLENVGIVSGKVTKSSDDFPYIEEHVKVQMLDPKAVTVIKDKIRRKENRQRQLQAEIKEVNDFIEGLPEGIEKQVFEMVYLDNMSQMDAAEVTGYTQSMISRIIKGVLKDS